MTLIAVISDYLLHPFYPQYFELRFGITDPKAVGYYFAAICFMVMISFPFWAFVAKKIAELKILVYTQLVAGILALYCFYTDNYLYFWIISLTMILFKASYLLVYPYILRIVKKEEHTHTIGILSVVVHLGGILGAIIGGLVVDIINANYIFLIMALGDFIQMFMSLYLLKNKKISLQHQENNTITTKKKSFISNQLILKLGLVTCILYFSDFITRPFFSMFWETISGLQSKIISGSIYAIPGIIALIALWINSKNKTAQNSPYAGLVPILCMGLLGLALQGIAIPWVLIIGRCIYGWAIFQGVVRFDVLLFELSTPDDYAIDYSKVHFFQNLGVLLSSLFVGIVVDIYGLHIPFVIAFLGFLITLVLYLLFFRTELKALKKIIQT